MKLDGTSELRPKSTSRLLEPCHNYERLKPTIIYHAVTGICFEKSITACGLGLSASLESAKGFSSCCKKEIGLVASQCGILLLLKQMISMLVHESLC